MPKAVYHSSCRDKHNRHHHHYCSILSKMPNTTECTLHRYKLRREGHVFVVLLFLSGIEKRILLPKTHNVQDFDQNFQTKIPAGTTPGLPRRDNPPRPALFPGPPTLSYPQKYFRRSFTAMVMFVITVNTTGMCVRPSLCTTQWT